MRLRTHTRHCFKMMGGEGGACTPLPFQIGSYQDEGVGGWGEEGGEASDLSKPTTSLFLGTTAASILYFLLFTLYY